MCLILEYYHSYLGTCIVITKPGYLFLVISITKYLTLRVILFLSVKPAYTLLKHKLQYANEVFLHKENREYLKGDEEPAQVLSLNLLNLNHKIENLAFDSTLDKCKAIAVMVFKVLPTILFFSPLSFLIPSSLPPFFHYPPWLTSDCICSTMALGYRVALLICYT